MEKKLSCFVIIGYGKKPSYANGKLRLLDLDETYSLLIKPVFDALEISCFRAIDKNLAGSIDELMLEEIENADIALVDISTLNANVMWELGVRHALKPYHTIMICEKEQMSSIPFDINSFIVYQYAHSEEGIPYREVERFKSILTNTVKGVIAQNPHKTDSPVHTFLKNRLNREVADSEILKAADVPRTETFATIMENSEKAKKENDYAKALELLAVAKSIASQNMTLKDNLTFIISRQALCTYKAEKPNQLEAFVNAKIILEELKPVQSQNTEVLGLSGAIHKRLFEITSDDNYLDEAILFYQKGFMLKQDYYNGINVAFMLYEKAALLKHRNEEWDDVKLNADYIRNSVLSIALKLEQQPNFVSTSDAMWVLFSIAEAYNYKKNEAKMKEYEEKAMELSDQANDTFGPDAYNLQKAKIQKIFETLD